MKLTWKRWEGVEIPKRQRAEWARDMIRRFDELAFTLSGDSLVVVAPTDYETAVYDCLIRRRAWVRR